MSKHTPGEWLFRPILSNSENDKGFRVFSHDDGIDHESGYVWIADVSPVIDNERGDASEEGKANTRLIAAAPELLEAAKLVMEHSGLLFHPGEDGCRMCDARFRIQAAIAKAEGRS